MKERTMKTLLIIQLMVIVLIVKWIIPNGDEKNKTELLREISPDGDYVLLIEELGTAVFTYDCIKVTLYENSNSPEYYSASFWVDVHTGGGNAHYGIEWLEDGVQVILSGSESDYYILPFQTSGDSQAH